MLSKLPYIWDYDIDEDTLKDILSGKVSLGHLDIGWATIRLFEYASYQEIVRLLGYREIVNRWPHVRKHIRAQGRKRGFDFLVEWLKTHHQEKISHG